MSFISLQYIVFLPVVAGCYFLLPHAYRWIFLLVASCVFYMAFIPKYLLVLAFSIVIDFLAGIKIEGAKGNRRKCWLAISVAANLGLLGIFKYFNFFASAAGFHPIWQLALPLGLSFHTFQAMAYNFEVYYARQKAERHFGLYALYILFFPQLVAGPIERPQHMLPQFREEHQFKEADAVAGLRMILWGFFRKLVIADNLALITDSVFADPASHSGASICFAAVCFSMQIYADFSAYSFIAIGSARIMGFRLVQNFRFPYQSASIREFWTRWHISLSSWFRDYVYIPLGGNRQSLAGWCITVMIVFLLSGLWHGANWTFLIWGAWNGLLVIAGFFLAPLLKRLPFFNTRAYLVLAPLFCFGLLTLGWIFFRAASVEEAIFILRKIAATLVALPGGLSSDQFIISIKGVSVSNVRFCYFLLFFLPLIEYIIQRRAAAGRLLPANPGARRVLYYALLLFIFLAGEFGDKRFIYFQF